MSYCLNPACQQPRNPGDAKFCQTCGLGLVLSERYRALSLIGQGGFGRTYLAVDEAAAGKPRCVIKQLFPRALGAPPTPVLALAGQPPSKAAELFNLEAQQLEQLGSHPQIPQLLDRLERADGHYLIQEFIDGQNLAQILAEEGAFSEDRVRKLLNDLLPVLSFIHAHQIIHRDIKPENIICSPTRNAPVLVDFGASKFATHTALARTGTVIGSAGYVAPEQAIGRAEYASDLYSLGITCAHLLTAVHPFDLYSVSEDAWVWRQYLSAPISESLGRVIDKLLYRATSQRYRTAAAVLADLNATPLRAPRRVPIAAGGWQNDLLAEPIGLRAAIAPDSPISAERSAIDQPWGCRHTLTGHDGIVTSVAVSHDGFFLASGSSDRTIRLWDIETGVLIHTFAGRSLWSTAGHSDRVREVRFSPTGQTLISASDDGTIKFWDLATKKLLNTLTSHDWGVAAIVLSADGQTLISGGNDGAIRFWDLETGALIDSFRKHRASVCALALSADGQTLISGGDDAILRVWDLRSNRLINTLSGHSDRISAAVFSSDWRFLISAGWDNTLQFWDLSRGESLKTITVHTDAVNCLALSPAAPLLVSGSEDGTLKLGDLMTGKRLDTLRHAWGVNAVAFSPDGETLVSGSADETIKIWRQD